MTVVPPDLAPGMRLDRYEIIRRINRGGMATVWIARLVGEPGSAKLFALKTILPELAGDAEMRAMFLDEANIASRIEHPNVARVYELGEAHGVLFQVMELVRGESLHHLQRRVHENGETFPMGIAMRICADACLGLHAAHEQNDPDGNPAGIVHRDVSPANILVSREGVAKVIDFGIAKAVNRASEETRTGLMKGKLRYMAPEQAMRGNVDRRADVWSMGAVFYSLMNGAPPFEESNDVQIIARLLRGGGPEPLTAKVPSVVRAIVEKAMSVDPDHRYASTLEMAAALEAVMISTAATASAEEVGAFVAPVAVGDTDALSEALEPQTPAAEAIAIPQARRARASVVAGALLLMAGGAFVILRGEANERSQPGERASAPPEPPVLAAPGTTPPPPAVPAPPANPPPLATAMSSAAATIAHPPLRTRPKPRQKR